MKDLEEKLSDLEDTKSTLTHICEALQNAESVETDVDFDASIEEAIASMRTLIDELREIVPAKRGKRGAPPPDETE